MELSPAISEHRVRISYDSIETLIKQIPAEHGGRVRIDEDGKSHWYTIKFTPTEICYDMPGSCKILNRRSLKG